jgi:hypothetical protein
MQRSQNDGLPMDQTKPERFEPVRGNIEIRRKEIDPSTNAIVCAYLI